MRRRTLNASGPGTFLEIVMTLRDTSETTEHAALVSAFKATICRLQNGLPARQARMFSSLRPEASVPRPLGHPLCSGQ